VPWACGWGQAQGAQTPRVETLGYDWEEVVSALRCSGKRTEVRGRGALVWPPINRTIVVEVDTNIAKDQQ